MFAVKTAISILLLATVIAVVGYQYGFTSILDHVRLLSMPLIGMIVVGLLANAMLAVLRFKVLAADAGHPIGLRRAMAAVGAGSLAGAMFFQLAGQLMARGVVMRRDNVPFGAVVMVTLYERIVAALVSGLIAVFGALHIFGRIYLDQAAGGGQLIKIACGLIAAIGVGGWLGFGPLVEQNILPLLSRQVVLRMLRIAGLTVLVQLPMMSVYVAIAHEFSPAMPIVDLAAASAVVMFAASVPISLAGWGVRELSAVVALGAVGMSTSGALATAIIIGAGSLLAMGVIFAISFEGKQRGVSAGDDATVATIDYAEALAWILPLTAAVFVLFQIYVPIGSGLLNVNLADPVVILGGSLFVLRAVAKRQWPQWRVSHVNLFALLATLALGYALLLGAWRFGWTNWALVNRFVGWFVLLAYAATGALITSIGDIRALRIFTLTAVGAAVGIIVIDVTLVVAHTAGWHTGSLVTPGAISGFAQNRNAFALQLLMILGGVVVFLEGKRARHLVFATFFAALWLAGSRSGWISLVCLLAAAVYFGRATAAEILAAAVAAVGFAATLILISHINFGLHGGGSWSNNLPDLLPEPTSTAERVESLSRGWSLFVSHPFFGAGLGAFNHLDIRTGSGVPLVIHSTALWLLAELGLVGFLVFAIFGFYVWFTEWRRPTPDLAAALVIFCFLSFAIMSGPADMMYQRTFWLIVGAALAVPRASPSEHDAPAASVPSPG